MTEDQAKRIIEDTLQQLELQTGSVVRGIGLRETDVTQFADTVKQLQMEVIIDLERLPGHNWRTW